jgi:putative phosphoesterase
MARIAGADEIWHLGDVCSPVLIRSLERIGPPVRVVQGNCDNCPDWPLQLDFEIEGVRVRLEHIPPSQPPPGFDLLLHGHTHVPRNELRGSIRFLNPGCISRPNRGAPASFGWLELNRGEEPRWRVEPVD